jgi:hypothetical protein
MDLVNNQTQLEIHHFSELCFSKTDDSRTNQQFEFSNSLRPQAVTFLLPKPEST